jgi:hypothetical protein
VQRSYKMGLFPELVEGVPFVWTLICCIAVYAFGLPLYASDPASTAVQVVVACVWGLLAFIVSLGTLSYLFRAFLNPRKFFHENGGNGSKKTILLLLFFFDVWFSLLTMQAAVLYVPYMFDPVNAFADIGTANGPWYVYMEMFVTACNNFHGASNVGVDALSVVPMIWLSICSIVARMFTWFAVAILVRFTLLKVTTSTSKRLQ